MSTESIDSISEIRETSVDSARPGGPSADAAAEKVSPARRIGRSRGLIGVIAIAIGLIALGFLSPGTLPGEGEHVGAFSLLPALVTLVVVFATKNVVAALFLGVVTGGVVSAEYNIVDGFMLPSLGTVSFATILLVYLWALGGLIGLWTRTGGAQAFAEMAGRTLVRGPVSARVFGWLVGVLFHQGGTISTILAGTTVRPLTDKHKVSKEELTYIVDSTASPVATVLPFNAWPLYVAGLIVGTTPLFATEDQGIAFFISSIPYNFYAIFALLATLLFAWGKLPWVGGAMKKAIHRARTTGQLNAPTAKPITSDELVTMKLPKDYSPGLADFAVPMGVLLTVVVGSYAITGKVLIAQGFGLAVITAIVLALVKGLPLGEAIEGFVDGCKGVTVGALILALAVTLGYVSKQLGTANYIVETTSNWVVDPLLPAILMVICMVVAFSIGSSWGTFAVVFPLAMPLAYAIDPNPIYLHLCFGAVVGGAVFGDQASPISDTTILSALACGGDVMDHVRTQLPLAFAAASLAAATSTTLALVVL
ncbi:Malate-2H(+)/Na(+)-lactate antiporter [Nocardia otitidiscaviarum]|uniref:Malate-2H(+)/Na(+)-lactate antiporter n=1 Tax=Nocardia otitidiscaviarum TaxID=1823 RepID=A0A378Y9W4_9NOCA|nr:Na+/H+ antiporter NhaC family protein [Nocardia otitidiscaviarum]SUA73291.1 Malate-2H(+)/Na(+)-lactate antiporter [Nocardia otitidiscaviarum]